jgi:16S rRNA (cytosine1402-N4)-methyltransferase
MSAADKMSEVPVSESVHVSVLLHEIVSALNSKTYPFWYLDGTLGGAGHALAIAEAYEKANGKKLSIIGLDRDSQAIERAKKILEGKADRLILECENFRNLDAVLDKHAPEIMQANQSPTMNAILLDLGLSSDELENSGRGFTFQKDEPLLMTMGDPAKYPFTAATIVNSWKEEDIANVIFGYGEDRYARRIAKAIVAYREKKSIETSGELAEIVKAAVPRFGRSFNGRPAKIHPATKTFQALRIAVNDELVALKEGLAKGYERLAPGGKMAVISFHSLEDRIVKQYFKQCAGKIITKRPITASPQEIAENPRSRSAKLRIIEKPTP